MQIIRNLNQAKDIVSPLALTIGNFDGMHLGHVEIVNKVKKIAKEKKLASAILTFEPHPISILRPNKAKDFRIFSLGQKLSFFRDNQVDYAIILPFNQAISEISALNFVREILVKSLKTEHLVIGYDFIFGKNRQGNFSLLEQESKNSNFDLSEISAIQINDEVCSSSIIRKLISEGNIAKSNHLLKKDFSISGLVVQGRKLANQLGFPTANLLAKPHIIKPKFGVYKTETFIPHLNQKFASITNFGIKPTFNNSPSKPIFETHILNFSQNIYGKKIFVNFLDFIREEKKFSSIEALRKQIIEDLKSI